jgi:fructose-bisphosphate aldolase class II
LKKEELKLSSLDLITKSTGAVGAFNVIHLEHAEAFVAAANDANRPTILQISENAVKFHGSLKPIGVATLAIAQSSKIPVSVHLDHAESEELIHEALDLGFDSIMFDGSKLAYADNVAASARVATLCKKYGATIEVELGEIGGKDGVHAPGVRTNPAQAKSFVEATGVDLLAVAVGSSHAMQSKTAQLDFDLISELATALPVPLVLHGSSGVNDPDLVRAVEAGMRKINIATYLNQIFTSEVRTILNSDASLVDTRKYFAPAREAMRVEVARLLQLLAP